MQGMSMQLSHIYVWIQVFAAIACSISLGKYTWNYSKYEYNPLLAEYE
jgi:hypothetical protein